MQVQSQALQGVLKKAQRCGQCRSIARYELSLACTHAAILYVGVGVHACGSGSVYLPYVMQR